MNDVIRALLRIVARLAAAILFILFLQYCWPWVWRMFSPFIIALPSAILLQRPIRWSEKRLRLKHSPAVAIWVVLLCAVLCALLYWLISTAVSQILQLSGNYQTLAGDLVSILRTGVNRFVEILDELSEDAAQWIRGVLNDGLAILYEGVTTFLGNLVSFTFNFASSIPYALIYLNFLLLGIYFITANYPRLKARFLKLMGKSFEERSQMLTGSAGKGLISYIQVQLLYAVIVFIVSWPCLQLFGMSYSFLIALFVSILEFLPIFGNGTLYVPWAIILYLIGEPASALKLLILYLSLYLFRRFTEPKLLSRQIGLTPLTSLVAMFAGMSIAGVLGLILGPIVMVVLQAALKGHIFDGIIRDIRCVFQYSADMLRDPKDKAAGEPKVEQTDNVPE